MTAPSLPGVLAPATQSRFPHRACALLALFAAPGVSLDVLGTRLSGWHREQSTRDRNPRGRSRLGLRMAGTEDDLQQSVGSYFGEAITPLDAFVTVEIGIDQPGMREFDALAEQLEDVGGQLPHVVDRERSFAMAGLVNLVLADDGPFAMILTCAHHPDVRLVDAHAWWCSFGEVMASGGQGHTLGYHQIQCDPGLSIRAAGAVGLSTAPFDMGDLVYLRAVDEFVAAAGSQARPARDPGPPVNQRDKFITFHGAVGAFCTMLDGR